MVLHSSVGGDNGWGSARYTIATSKGDTSLTGTLQSGSIGAVYFCLEDGLYEITVTEDTLDTNNVVWFVFDDSSGEAFRGMAPIVDIFHAESGRFYTAPPITQRGLACT